MNHSVANLRMLAGQRIIGWPLALFALIVVALQVTSVVIGVNYSNNPCIGGGSNTTVPWNLPWSTYLWVSGIGFFGATYAIVLLFALAKNSTSTVCAVVGALSALLLVLAEIVWIVYGALLYFWFVQPHCHTTAVFYVFGMLWFLLNSVTLLLGIVVIVGILLFVKHLVC